MDNALHYLLIIKRW